MTITETRGATDADTALVTEAIDALLAEHDPTAMDDVAFRGARYDAGLAWVHFPEGHGGLGVRPERNKLVETRLREAGAKPTEPCTMAPTMSTAQAMSHSGRVRGKGTAHTQRGPSTSPQVTNTCSRATKTAAEPRSLARPDRGWYSSPTGREGSA